MSKYISLQKPVPVCEQNWNACITPVVSICCTTYNHRDFIEEAIESFLMQETTFPVEILIHDDASNDGTAQIINKYEKKFPFLIKPIYQSENKYSKGVRITQVYQLPRVRGEFVALCEGDDYWISPKKLERQVKFLREHNDAKFVFHNALIINEVENKISLFSDRACASWHDFQTLIDRNFIPTASKLTRTKNLFVSPDIPAGVPEDWVGHFWESLNGKFYYSPEVMSVYRVHLGGAWSLKARSFQLENSLKTLIFLDTKTHFHYKQHFEIARLKVYKELLKARELTSLSELSKLIFDALNNNSIIVLWGYGSLGKFILAFIESLGVKSILIVDKRDLSLELLELYRSPEQFLGLKFDRDPLILISTMFWNDLIDQNFGFGVFSTRNTYIVSDVISNG